MFSLSGENEMLKDGNEMRSRSSSRPHFTLFPLLIARFIIFFFFRRSLFAFAINLTIVCCCWHGPGDQHQLRYISIRLNFGISGKHMHTAAHHSVRPYAIGRQRTERDRQNTIYTTSANRKRPNNRYRK